MSSVLLRVMHRIGLCCFNTALQNVTANEKISFLSQNSCSISSIAQGLPSAFLLLRVLFLVVKINNCCFNGLLFTKVSGFIEDIDVDRHPDDAFSDKWEMGILKEI